MCLYIKSYKRSHKSLFTRTYYKILLDYGEGIYTTPFRSASVRLNTIISEDVNERISMIRVSYKPKISIITEEAIHLYKHKKDAIDDCKVLNAQSTLTTKYVVVKAIVPKSTHVISGKINNSTRKGICTKRVIYKPL